MLGNITNGNYIDVEHIDIQGRESHGQIHSNSAAAQLGLVEITYTISEDGDRITERQRYNNGEVHDHIYLWQR